MSLWKKAGCQTESKALEKSIVDRIVNLQPLALKRFFSFQELPFSNSMLSLTKTKSFAYKILFIKPSLAYSVITSTAIAKKHDANTDT